MLCQSPICSHNTTSLLTLLHAQLEVAAHGALGLPSMGQDTPDPQVEQGSGAAPIPAQQRQWLQHPAAPKAFSMSFLLYNLRHSNNTDLKVFYLL